MVRSVIFWMLVVIYTVIYGVSVMIVSVIDPSGKGVAAICRSWARLVLYTSRVKVYVEGADFTEFSGPRIYMSNHQSYFDVLALMAYLPDNARFVAKKSLEMIPIFGQAMRAAGTVIIDRKHPEKARKSLSQTGSFRMGRGIGVIIFPEGTRSRTGEIGQFKKGGFVLALESGATIVPVGINGSRNILPADGYHVKPGKIRISIGQPIPTGNFSLGNKEALIEKTRREVGRLANLPLSKNTEDRPIQETEANYFVKDENPQPYEHINMPRG